MSLHGKSGQFCELQQIGPGCGEKKLFETTSSYTASNAQWVSMLQDTTVPVSNKLFFLTDYRYEQPCVLT